MRVHTPFLIITLCLNCFHVAVASPQGQIQPSAHYQKSEFMVPARDGVHLHTQVWAPENNQHRLPFLFVRTPYGLNSTNKMLDTIYRDLANDGYIFVFQDIRGRAQSEGRFIMLRPLRDVEDKFSTDESTDAYDTVDWLIANIPNNNGRVGVLGISYDGWLTVMAIQNAHPAIKAASEQASCADMFLGDDFHHNGAFRLSYGFEYAALLERSKNLQPFPFGSYDTFDWFLRSGTDADIGNSLEGKSPTWINFVEHPNYDQFWQTQAVVPHLHDARVPMLNVAGWFDQEDFYGPMVIYRALEQNDFSKSNFLVVGPWNHGGWVEDETGHALGRINFGSDTSTYFRSELENNWFGYWLKDRGKLQIPEARVFQTGSNEWRDFDKWPPINGIEKKRLFLSAGGSLSFNAPSSTSSGSDSYVSDPARPVPYRARPIPPLYTQPGWGTWLTDDQRFVHLRPDVLSWETDPLNRDVCVSGEIVAHIFASTTGTDVDWIVKLIDEYPSSYAADESLGGFQLMVSGEVLRGRFRKSFEYPKPIPVNQVVPYTIPLHSRSHCFLKGHRIMTEIQSSWFPLIDRNPQTFETNIYKASSRDFQVATQRIFRTRKFPSHIELPVETRR